jgi:predicted dehydrogenase
MNRKLNRRDFFRSTALAGASLWAAPTIWAEMKSPNEKLNIAGVGAGGQAGSDINNVSSENIVALCDVDEKRAAGNFNKFSKAKKYYDYRVMLEKEVKNIDAVVVGTPDHNHAPASALAMKLGKHVYCEKPLTHSVYEARALRELANKHKVATQMGNQGTASSGLRQGVEVLQSGALGNVREMHVWTNRPIWPQGIDTPTDKPPVPKTLKWDLWLGPAPERPYHPAYLPFTWRGWWDFGTGALGDMACHTLNLPYWGLKLVHPVSFEAESSELKPDSAPQWSIIRYQFPARGDLPPLKMTWYDGGKKPPAELFEGENVSESGTLMIGDKGKMYSPGDYGTDYTLLPKNKFEGYKPPDPTIPRSPGHHKEWIDACKGGPAAMSNFNYSGPLTEVVVLGNLAVRAAEKVEWDADNLKAKNSPKANGYVRRDYRKGWTL